MKMLSTLIVLIANPLFLLMMFLILIVMVSMSKKLSSEDALKTENDLGFDDSEMSEISVEDVIDCSVFTKEKELPTNNLISKHSVEYARKLEKGKLFEEKAVGFPKIHIVSNQVFVKSGLDKNETKPLKSLGSEDNKVVCQDFFWSGPINNSHETKGLSELTSWKVKGKYVSELLNSDSARFNVASTSGTKSLSEKSISNISKSKTSKSNILKSAEELIAKKRLMNARYKKNLKERKRFWREQNAIPFQPKQASKPKAKIVTKQVQPVVQKPKEIILKPILKPVTPKVIKIVFKPKIISKVPLPKPVVQPQAPTVFKSKVVQPKPILSQK